MKIISLLLLLLVTSVGCSQTQELDNLNIGLMPSMDGLPIIIAKEKGYFEELGLKVNYTIYSNGTDRETELNTGVTHGAVTDILGLITLNNSGQSFKATSSTDTLMPILSNEEYKDVTPQVVGTAEVSVTNFLLTHWLEGTEYTKEFINAIPQRIEMLQGGLITMAMVPEPMASRGELAGLTKTVYPMPGEYSPNILIFNNEYIEGHSAELKAFYQAYNRAVAFIKENEAESRDILVSSMNLDASIKELIDFPTYSNAQLFDETYFNTINTWVETNLDITSNLPYKDLVDGSYLAQ